VEAGNLPATVLCIPMSSKKAIGDPGSQALAKQGSPALLPTRRVHSCPRVARLKPPPPNGVTARHCPHKPSEFPSSFSYDPMAYSRLAAIARRSYFDPDDEDGGSRRSSAATAAGQASGDKAAGQGRVGLGEIDRDPIFQQVRPVQPQDYSSLKRRSEAD
jgi:hypothetical protein